MGNDNILIVAILAVVAYFMLTPSKTLAEIEHKITKGTFETGTVPCTRGDLYRSNTAVCDAGYEATTWFGLTDCKCISGIYTDIPDAAQSPQTPAPTPTYPYVSTSPAGGTGQCKMYRDGQWWALSGCDADDYNCKEYKPATTVDYFMRECKA